MIADQKGFTLVELIAVMVILGILAASAFPKTTELTSDARKAVIKSTAGSMFSANTMIYGKAQTIGSLGSTMAPANIVVSGNTVAVAYGFAASASSLSLTLDLYPSSDFTINNSSIMLAKAPTPVKCIVKYTPAGFDVSGTFKRPSYIIDDSGC
jgi:MSHA pilin protein MshA